MGSGNANACMCDTGGKGLGTGMANESPKREDKAQSDYNEGGKWGDSQKMRRGGQGVK